VDTYINYCKLPPEGEQLPVVYHQTAGYRRREYDSRPVQVTDVRSCEQELDIDANGFQYVKIFDAAYELFKDDETVKDEVYPKAAEFLNQQLGATHVHVNHHIVRREPHQKSRDLPKDIADTEKVVLQTPAVFAHVDQSFKGARHQLCGLNSAEDLAPKSKSRWGIVNIWHPLKPVRREPLAVCDAQTLKDEDLREVCFRSETQDPAGRKGLYQRDAFLWQLAANPEHRWYYKSEMDPGDALLIKCFDTKMDGRARCAGHSAIVTPQDFGPPRESIEIRCFVFWEDQPHEGEEVQYVSQPEDHWVPVSTTAAGN